MKPLFWHFQPHALYFYTLPVRSAGLFTPNFNFLIQSKKMIHPVKKKAHSWHCCCCINVPIIRPFTCAFWKDISNWLIGSKTALGQIELSFLWVSTKSSGCLNNQLPLLPFKNISIETTFALVIWNQIKTLHLLWFKDIFHYLPKDVRLLLFNFIFPDNNFLPSFSPKSPPLRDDASVGPENVSIFSSTCWGGNFACCEQILIRGVWWRAGCWVGLWSSCFIRQMFQLMWTIRAECAPCSSWLHIRSCLRCDCSSIARRKGFIQKLLERLRNWVWKCVCFYIYDLNIFSWHTDLFWKEFIF